MIIYCCKTCGNKIGRHSALYGGAECKSCSKKGSKSWNFKNYPKLKFYACKCCGNKISYNNFLYGNRLCNSCATFGPEGIGRFHPRDIAGNKNPNWKEGVTPLRHLIRNCEAMKVWIKSCLVRDNYTCQVCGQRGGNLEIHHKDISFAKILIMYNIKSVKQALTIPVLWDINNGQTLCKQCHSRTFNNLEN